MKLRVAHIITQLELGGAQRNTLYTVGHLNPELHEAFLLCGRGGILDKETVRAKWPTHFIYGLVRPLRPWWDIVAAIALYVKLRTLKPHVVHTHSSKAGILGRLAAYFAGVPVIVHTFHGFGFNRQQKPWTRWLFITLERLCAPLSTHLVFVSEENRKEAEQLRIGNNIPTSLIRSGIKREEPKRPGGTQYERRSSNKIHKTLERMPENAWRVSYVGNFKPQKNPMDLVRVAAEVIQAQPQVHFIMTGDGELKDSVMDWCKQQNLISNIHFLGWCERSGDILDILKASHCFLMTSLWEGLPRALLEAMITGLPAVAYNVDGIADIVSDGKTGFLVPPKDVSYAAQKVIWLATHPDEAKAMGKKGQARVTEEFDIDHMVRQQETLYRDLYDKVPLKEYYEAAWQNTPS